MFQNNLKIPGFASVTTPIDIDFFIDPVDRDFDPRNLIQEILHQFHLLTPSVNWQVDMSVMHQEHRSARLSILWLNPTIIESCPSHSVYVSGPFILPNYSGR